LGTWRTYWELDGNPVGTWREHVGNKGKMKKIKIKINPWNEHEAYKYHFNSYSGWECVWNIY
jgi:hypothetical protein